jgi:hypothetical protein
MLAESGFWQNADHFFGVFLLLWRPCNSHTTTHSLTGPVGQPFASCLGVSGSRPRDSPTLTRKPVSLVSAVSLQW